MSSPQASSASGTLIKALIGLATGALLSWSLPASAQLTAQSPAPAAFDVKIVGPLKGGEAKQAELIFIPGLASSREVWSGLLETLCQSRRCHLLQLAGFAGSAPIEGALLAQTLTQLRGYIAAQPLSKQQAPVVIGHSLGGFLALQLASGANSPVAKAVVVDALPAFGALQQPAMTAAQLQTMGEQMKAQLLTQDPALFAAQQQDSLARMVTAPADLGLVRKAAAASDRPTVIKAMAEMIGQDLRPTLATIVRPVLVLGSWASYKPYAKLEQVEALYRQQYQGLKDLRLTMAPDGLHFLMLDQRDWTLAQLQAFLP